jgi:hypothetical protein
VGTSLLVDVAVTAIVWGVVFMIAAWLASDGIRAKAARKVLAPTLRDSPGVVYGGFAAAMLLYFAWAPTHGLRAVLTVLALTALGVAGIGALRRQAAEEFPPERGGLLSRRQGP